MFCRECGKEVRDNAVACLSCGVRPRDGVNYCQECGSPTNVDQFVCVKCGVNLSSSFRNIILNKKILPSNPPKKPVLALILSFFIMGLGQVYLGQVWKGIAIFIATIIIGFLTFGLGCPVMFVISPVDAYKIAKKLEAGNSVGQWEFF